MGNNPGSHISFTLLTERTSRNHRHQACVALEKHTPHVADSIMSASPIILHFISCVVISWFLVINVYSAPKPRPKRGKASTEEPNPCVKPEPIQLPRFDIKEMTVLGPALPATVTVEFKSKYPLRFRWQKEQTVTLIRSKSFQMMNYFYIPVANDSLHKIHNSHVRGVHTTKLTVSKKREYNLHPFDVYILKVRILHPCYDVGMKLAIPRTTDGHLVTMIKEMAFPRFLQMPLKSYTLQPGDTFHLNVSMLIEFMDEHTEQSGWYKILQLDEEMQKVEYADSIHMTPRDNFKVVNAIRRPEFSKYIVSSNAAISPVKDTDAGLYGYYLVLPEGIHIRVTTEIRMNESVPNSMVQSCSGATEQDGMAPNFRIPIMRKLDNCIGCVVANMDNPKIGLYKIKDVNGTLQAFEIKMSDKYPGGSNFTTAMFPIKKPSDDDDAQYICEAEDKNVNIQRAFGVTTFLPVKLTVVKPNRVDIEKPTKVVFTCKATGFPAPEIIFYKGPRDDANFFNVHRPFDPDTEKGWVRVARRKHITFHVRYDPKRGTTKARLVFNKATKKDAGGDDYDYKCVARNKYSYNIGFISIYYNGYDDLDI
ncbi:uncharacterized protein LOC135485346 [Lineus longissimus]|uniref:uncharacterized protein LOC135485346 n=1 Tax=Lineus longissimus TaxID=88925 RepID=UPI002B4C69C4